MTAFAPAVPGALATRPLSVRTAAALAVLATLPFTYALTIRVGFPLKLYELVLVASAVIAFAEGRVRVARGSLRVLAPMLLFAVWAMAGTAYRLVAPPSTFDGSGFSTRFGPVGDAVLKSGYLGLALWAFLLVASVAYEEPRRVARWWMIGAAASATYAWVLFLSSVFALPAPLLPGMEQPQIINVGGRELFRGGTFEEGNYFAMYVLCSVAVAAWLRWYRAALALSVTMLITFSTANTVSLALFWMLLGWFRASRERDPRTRLLIAGGAVGAVALAVIVLLPTGYLQAFIVDKLVSDDPGSKLDRLDLTVAGLRMALEHPVMGVGFTQFGYHYRAYNLTDIFAVARPMKATVVNVWVEILSETGLVGLALVLAFGKRLWQAARAAIPSSDAFRAALPALALSLLTYPTYTVAFLWAFLALIAGEGLRARDGVTVGA